MKQSLFLINFMTLILSSLHSEVPLRYEDGTTAPTLSVVVARKIPNLEANMVYAGASDCGDCDFNTGETCQGKLTRPVTTGCPSKVSGTKTLPTVYAAGSTTPQSLIVPDDKCPDNAKFIEYLNQARTDYSCQEVKDLTKACKLVEFACYRWIEGTCKPADITYQGYFLDAANTQPVKYQGGCEKKVDAPGVVKTDGAVFDRAADSSPCS